MRDILDTLNQLQEYGKRNHKVRYVDEPYDDTLSFTEDLDEVIKILSAPKFIMWLEDTDQNFGSKTASIGIQLKTLVQLLDKEFDSMAKF